MSSLTELLADVDRARRRYLAAVEGLTAEQGTERPAPGAWSAAEVTEHLYLAEMAGIYGMWKALDGLARGEPVWTGEQVHHGLTIEEIVDKTWEEKVEAPEIASPRWGGPLAYWVECLKSCDGPLRALGHELEEAELTEVVYPHPISGPLNAHQRLEFLRFHLDRHRGQAERVKSTLQGGSRLSVP